MHSSKHRSLCGVAPLVDQLVDETIALLILRSGSPQHLVLNLTRERALRCLQQMLYDDAACGQLSEQQLWQIVNAIVAAAIACALDDESDSIHCQHSLAHGLLFGTRRLRLRSALPYTQAQISDAGR